jgi:hypothetical protein
MLCAIHNIKNILDCVHGGASQKVSHCGARYMLIIIDDYSR